MKQTITKRRHNKITKALIGLLIIIGLLVVLTQVKNNENKVDENKVTISTTKGDIVVRLYENEAPITVENFKQYIQDDFYSETIFHRVIDGFMIQGGGFTSSGAQKETREPIVLEANKSNTRGTIAMARTPDPNSATSQFFINLKDNEFLDASATSEGYAVFGEVIAGMDVVDTIAKVPTSSTPTDDWPTETIRITKVTLGGKADV